MKAPTSGLAQNPTCTTGFVDQLVQALVRFGAASSAAGPPVLQLLTRHLLTVPLGSPEQLAAAASLPADLADLAASATSTGETLAMGTVTSE